MAEICKAIVAVLVAWIVGAWGLMLEVGVVHSAWWPFIPVMGFHAAAAIVGIVTLIAVVVGVMKVVFGVKD